MNSLIILADAKQLTNSEKQGRDGRRRSEETCTVLIDSDQSNINCRC